MYSLLLLFGQVFYVQSNQHGILYPKASETREVLPLDGIWNFRLKDPKASNSTTYLMPVPSSYNDITQDSSIRDHVGKVWYQRNFFVPKSWALGTRVWLRFGSVNYKAKVWINDQNVTEHETGHLPFQEDVSQVLKFGKRNTITVSVDNTLSGTTIPQGSSHNVTTENCTKLVASYGFDFFNYAGIHRPVVLYTTPVNYIDDITIETDVDRTTSGKREGIIRYSLSFGGDIKNNKIVVTLLDADNAVVIQVKNNINGTIRVTDAKLWWPYLMDPNPGYLYTLKVALLSPSGDPVDVYSQPIGIRKISWNNTSLMINYRPIYFHGFGRHEDADIRGKGLDLPTILRDHNLIQWVGANAYRTSHYPYAEEIMDLADKLGIMIIDECPSVDTHLFSDKLLENHLKAINELIKRDKNRPSVVMWSIANEPLSAEAAAGGYFEAVAKHVRSLDKLRPITLATAQYPSKDNAVQYLDVISFNRYNSWYSNSGHLDMITNNVINDATSWHNKFNKPVLMSEYGADTIAGLHISPAYVWSEEYQVEMMSKHFLAFDKLRQEKWFIGEFIWNFADFKTAQTFTRVGGNKKGIFTRDRQPKASAHHLRKRYFLLANKMYNTSIPDDLFGYLAPNRNNIRDEL